MVFRGQLLATRLPFRLAQRVRPEGEASRSIPQNPSLQLDPGGQRLQISEGHGRSLHGLGGVPALLQRAGALDQGALQPDGKQRAQGHSRPHGHTSLHFHTICQVCTMRDVVKPDH